MTDKLGYGKHDPVFSMAMKYQQCLEENEQLKSKIQDLKKVYEIYKKEEHRFLDDPEMIQPNELIDLIQAIKAVCEEIDEKA